MELLAVLSCAWVLACASPEADPPGGSSDARAAGDADIAAADAATDESCAGASGPAYVHGDLWAYWHNYRVACDRQHKWLWICEKRFGAGNCPEEQAQFDACWNATAPFSPSSWDGSTPAPTSPNYGVCQPHHWSEKNGADQRPGDPVPCDTTTFDYDRLRTSDPRYGVDWWTAGTSMRHLTVKVFGPGQNPQSQEGQGDALVVLSTHPGKYEAFTDALSNHSYDGHLRSGGCMPPITGDDEAPYPAQSFGAFFWLEVPTDRTVTLAASWIGPIGDDIGTACLNLDVFGFPPAFAYHAEPGKPWLIESPCWDLQRDLQLEPGRHYVWDERGFRMLPGCDGPPPELMTLVPDELAPSFADGTCSSMD